MEVSCQTLMSPHSPIFSLLMGSDHEPHPRIPRRQIQESHQSLEAESYGRLRDIHHPSFSHHGPMKSAGAFYSPNTNNATQSSLSTVYGDAKYKTKSDGQAIETDRQQKGAQEKQDRNLPPVYKYHVV